MGSRIRTVTHMTWPQMVRSELLRGRWVALDNVRYDPATSQPVEADVVDADEDLADLCSRMREADRTSCAILFCDSDSLPEPTSFRPSHVPPRAAQH
jgi:hypothetical protein